jgi:hypothetical protein
MRAMKRRAQLKNKLRNGLIKSPAAAAGLTADLLAMSAGMSSMSKKSAAADARAQRESDNANALENEAANAASAAGVDLGASARAVTAANAASAAKDAEAAMKAIDANTALTPDQKRIAKKAVHTALMLSGTVKVEAVDDSAMATTPLEQRLMAKLKDVEKQLAAAKGTAAKETTIVKTVQSTDALLQRAAPTDDVMPAGAKAPVMTLPKGIAFEGKAALHLGSSSALEKATEGFSVMARIQVSASGDATGMDVISHGGCGGVALRVVSLTDLVLGCNCDQCGDSALSAPKALTTGSFHTVTATFDRASGMTKLFVDGKVVASATKTYAFKGTGSVNIGGSTDPTRKVDTRLFQGTVKSLAAFDYALNDATASAAFPVGVSEE